MRVSKNKVLIAIIFLVFIGVLIFIFSKKYFSNPNQGTESIPSPTYRTPSVKPLSSVTPGVSPIQSVNKITILGVEMNNFYLNKIQEIEGNILITDDKGYQIVYLSQEQTFLLSILEAPFDKVRLKAEDEFPKRLGIDKSQACELKVIVTTPNFVNPGQAGINYPLSFCPK